MSVAGTTVGEPRAAGPGAPAPPARRRVRWPALALLVVALASLAGFLAYPTYPNYDSYYSLLWGRELVHGHLPSFEAYRAPTQHPLAVVFGGLVSVLGGGADRVLVGATMASFVALAAGLYRLGRASYGTLVGLAAGALLCTRFDFPLLALRAYIDIPYLAIVVWAAALEAQRPRRGAPVLALLATAGLLRPEAWVLAGVYWLWCLPGWTAPQRVRGAALVALAPVTWCAVDLVVTGNPVFSLTHTSGLAEELGRAKGLSAVPSQTLRFLSGLDKAPVLAGAVVGVVLAVRLFRERSRVPLALLVVGFGTFALVALGGFSIVFRYLLIPSLMLMLFAALALTGWTLLGPGTPVRRWWAIGSGALLVYAVVSLVTHVTPGHFVTDLRYRGGYHRSLEAVLRDPRVQAARRCGPVSLPNHKLVGEVRWILGAGERDVVARSDPRQRRRIRRGAAVYAAERKTLITFGYKPDGIRLALPMPGFDRAVTGRYFSVYTRC